jgi:LmbE family N-acetylglucosaminyl deacetylase
MEYWSAHYGCASAAPMSGFLQGVVDSAVRSLRPRWVRHMTAQYERFGALQSITLPAGTVLCVVAPHPDDESIGCGGLLALWTAAGRQGDVVFLTGGEMGSPAVRAMADPRQRAALMTAIKATRHTEATAALAILGGNGTWLNGTDGALQGDEERLVATLAAHWRSAPPDVIAAPYPADRHADHAVAARIAGQAALRVLPPHTRILAYEVWSAAPINAVLDISRVAEVKWRAIAAHASQVATTDYVRAVQGLNTYRAISAGQKAGYAEAYCAMDVAEYARIATSLKV